MNNISKLRIATDILSESDDFVDVSFIGILNWSSVPEAYKHDKTIIIGGHRISVYSLNSTIVLNITGVGFYQII